jgi:hypothetical protein
MTPAGDTLALDPGVRSAGSNRQPCLPDTAFLVVPPVVFDPLAQESPDRAEVGIWWHVEGDHPVLLQPLAVHPQRRESIQHRLPAPAQGAFGNGITRTVQLPDHATLSVAHRTPSLSVEVRKVSPDATSRANQGMLSRRTKSPPSGTAQSPSLATGGQPSSSWRSWNRTRT